MDRGMARAYIWTWKEEPNLCEFMVVAMMHSPLI
jgi:hypothetical protein